MKKKLFVFLFSIVLVLPIVFGLSACTTTWVNVKQDEKANYIQLHFNNYDGASLGSAKRGKDQKVYISLSKAYDPETLRIFNNNKEISWTKDPNFVESEELSGGMNNLGYFTLKKLKSDANFTFICQERTIEVKFELWSSEQGKKLEAADLTQEQISILSQYSFPSDSSCTIYNLATSGQTYQNTFTHLKDKNDNYEFIPEYILTNFKGPEIGSHQLDTNILEIDSTSQALNAYKLKLGDNQSGTTILKQTNVIRIDVDRFGVNTHNFIMKSETGLVKLEIGGQVDVYSVMANENKSVRISVDLNLAQTHNIKLENAKLKINDTVVSTYADVQEGEWKYQFMSSAHKPVSFSNDIFSNTKYEYYTIELLDVDFSEAEGILEVVHSNATGSIYRNENSQYVDATSGNPFWLYVDAHFDANESKLISLEKTNRSGATEVISFSIAKSYYSQDGSTKRYSVVKRADAYVLEEGDVEGRVNFVDFGYLTLHDDGSSYGNLSIGETLFEGKLVITIE